MGRVSLETAAATPVLTPASGFPGCEGLSPGPEGARRSTGAPGSFAERLEAWRGWPAEPHSQGPGLGSHVGGNFWAGAHVRHRRAHLGPADRLLWWLRAGGPGRGGAVVLGRGGGERVRGPAGPPAPSSPHPLPFRNRNRNLAPRTFPRDQEAETWWDGSSEPRTQASRETPHDLHRGTARWSRDTQLPSGSERGADARLGAWGQKEERPPQNPDWDLLPWSLSVWQCCPPPPAILLSIET
ncbi:collagen alpha-1(I) chain-like [Lynx rufus]|uniref:collagen alpha-1(I) chain-like n=1 Tax=Lynx rufus TaxID=61384 RepID=UPI001F1261F9|nr:collagen alpha-1(I) chain-like [Lynx rufus]